MFNSLSDSVGFVKEYFYRQRIIIAVEPQLGKRPKLIYMVVTRRETPVKIRACM